ncbi:MAG: MFS transporter [Nocardioidaceae bacterium]
MSNTNQSTDQPVSMEEAPYQRFHSYIAACTIGGPIVDGYILGIVAIALSQMTTDLSLSTTWQGLIGAGALIGLFIGGIAIGWVADLIGRRVMYTIDLLIFVIASVAHIWVDEPWLILVLRVILGIAVGADYPIATTLLAEFIPRRQRGSFLAALVGGWWFGYMVAFAVGYVVSQSGEGSWRWALASSAIPAVIILLLRLGMPESPVWLASKGRREEALAIVHKHIGPQYTLPELKADRPRSDYRRIFKDGYGRRTFFVSAFWFAQVLPAFAIFTFQPEILSGFGVENGALGTVLISVFFMVGVVPAVWLVQSWGRRPVLLIGFVIPAIALALLGLLPDAPIWLLFVLFVIFAMVSAGASVVQWVYPNELFPTDIRATAVGFGTAMSRVGAAVGTFLLPVTLSAFGTGPTMLIAAAVCVGGFLVSWPMAPETRGKSLTETSAADVPARDSAVQRST